jgi:hypothetical protein
MPWVLAAYLLALALFTFKADEIVPRETLGNAWRWLAGVGVCHFIFALVRAGNTRDPQDLIVAGIWEEGVSWLLLGISIFSLVGGLTAKRRP